MMTEPKQPTDSPTDSSDDSPDDSPIDNRDAFEQAVKDAGDGQYLLRLYISGATPRSKQAIASIKAICEEHLKGRYELEVIDIYQQPTLAKGEQIVALPTLIKRLPPPLRKLVGDMSNEERVLIGLDLRKKK
jgi:circadian clock protein KaiB